MVNSTVIWKYPIPITDAFTLRMPKGAQMLTVRIQQETPCLWVQVNSDAPNETRHFRIFGTGHSIVAPEQYHYIGTIQTHEGRLVWHVFEALGDNDVAAT